MNTETTMAAETPLPPGTRVRGTFGLGTVVEPTQAFGRICHWVRFDDIPDDSKLCTDVEALGASARYRGEAIAKPRILGQVTIRDCRFRYAVSVMRTRFGDAECFVLDAETPDEDGAPSVVAQGEPSQIRAWLTGRRVTLTPAEHNRLNALLEQI